MLEFICLALIVLAIIISVVYIIQGIYSISEMIVDWWNKR